MSYCVNCGVELDKTAKKCALCGVVVINPAQPQDTESSAPYPVPAEQLSTLERRYTAQILSIALGLQAVVCIIVNLFYFNSNPWSAYPVGAFMLVFTMVALPLMMKKPFLLFIALDGIAILVYLFMIERLSHGSGWFVDIAVPTVVYLFMALTAIYLYIRRRNPGKLRITAAAAFALGLLTVCIDASVRMYIYRSPGCSWSLIVLPCFSALALALYATSRYKRIHSELRKRLHV